MKQVVSVVGTTTLHVTMRDYKVRVVLDFVPRLAVPMFLETSSFDRFLKGMLPPQRKKARYSSEPVLILAMENML